MAEPSIYVVPDTVSAGVKTDEMLAADPYGFRVTWINWDSGFRGTDLRIGDRIIGVNGERLDREKRRPGIYPGPAIGAHYESQYWSKHGTSDDTDVTLTVYRRGRYLRPAESVDIRGKLRAERSYYSAEGRKVLGPGGPDLLRNDGFNSSWGSWYEQFTEFAARILDLGWQQRSFDSRMRLKEHLDGQERVQLLGERHPGPFAAQAAQDWEAVRTSLLGTPYQVTEQDLAYRQLGERRREEIAAAGTAAREAFLKACAGETIEPFPALDPFRDDRRKVVGKIVALPPITPLGWTMASGKTYVVSGGRDRGFYFADAEAAPLRRMFSTVERYGRKIGSAQNQRGLKKPGFCSLPGNRAVNLTDLLGTKVLSRSHYALPLQFSGRSRSRFGPPLFAGGPAGYCRRGDCDPPRRTPSCRSSCLEGAAGGN